MARHMSDLKRRELALIAALHDAFDFIASIKFDAGTDFERRRRQILELCDDVLKGGPAL